MKHMETELARQRKGPYHQFYLSHVQHAINVCRTVSSLQHPAEKGHIREILLRSLFRPLLPNDLGVGTGFVVGAAGAISTQQDIVIYDRYTLPPALYDSEVGIFPIESVLRTIEIKSMLTCPGLTDSHNAAHKLKSMWIHDDHGNIMLTEGPRPFVSILALNTDLSVSGKNDIERYLEVCNGTYPHLSSICVVGRGYWWFEDDAFNSWPEQYDFSEIIGFLSGILNAIPKQCDERRYVRPPLGAYLIDFGADFTLPIIEIGRLSDEFDATLKKGQYTNETLLSFPQRLSTLAEDLNRVFSQYKGDKLTEKYKKVLDFIECIKRKFESKLADTVKQVY